MDLTDISVVYRSCSATGLSEMNDRRLNCPVKHSMQLRLWVVTWTSLVPPEQLAEVLPEHLRYIVELEGRGVVVASGPPPRSR